MDSTTVRLDERHFKAAAAKARELGTTPERFIQSLIDAATMSFDQILEPVRKGFAKSGVTEEELDQTVAKARKSIRAGRRRTKRN